MHGRFPAFNHRATLHLQQKPSEAFRGRFSARNTLGSRSHFELLLQDSWRKNKHELRGKMLNPKV